MHREILNSQQIDLLPLIQEFGVDFGLVGGTAISLQIGHRQSIDFDLFTNKKLNNSAIRQKVIRKYSINQVFQDDQEEFTLVINGVKLTFLYYPFAINFTENLDDIIKTPDLKTLAAMKAYALGRRAKWKDYVDLYFILKDYFSLEEITKRAQSIFKNEFNEKNFRTQLAYFKDIDYSEKVIFCPGFEVSEEEIKSKLLEFSLEE